MNSVQRAKPYSVSLSAARAYLVSDPYSVIHAALKKGTSYYIIDDPAGSQTAPFGINDTGEFAGSYQPLHGH